jgi:hypothetical protein
MHLYCPHCHHALPHEANPLPSRFAIGAAVWIYHGASRRRGTGVGVTFRVLSIDYLVHTDIGVENVPSLDVTPHQPPQAVEGNVVTLASRGAACT